MFITLRQPGGGTTTATIPDVDRRFYQPTRGDALAYAISALQQEYDQCDGTANAYAANPDDAEPAAMWRAHADSIDIAINVLAAVREVQP